MWSQIGRGFSARGEFLEGEGAYVAQPVGEGGRTDLRRSTSLLLPTIPFSDCMSLKLAKRNLEKNLSAAPAPKACVTNKEDTSLIVADLI